MPAFVLALALALVACSPADRSAGSPGELSPPAPGATATPGPDSPTADEAVAGVDHAGLRELLARHWEWGLTQAPVHATTLGDHRYDDRLAPNSPADIAASRQTVREFLRIAHELPRAQLSASDGITLALFIDQLESAIAQEVCQSHKWSVSAFGTPVSRFNRLPEQHRLATPADGRTLLARYRAIPDSVDHSIGHLRAGLQEGLVANAESVRRAIELVDGQLAKPVTEWPMVERVREAKALARWSEDERTALVRDIEVQVREHIKPAFTRYRALLADIQTRARTGNRVGVGALPIGEACYRARIRSYIALPRTPAELHQLGLDEIKRINDEMRALGKKLFQSDDLARIVERLRTDPALYFTSKADVLQSARAALAQARSKMSQYFGILPKAECVVVEIPEYEAPYTTIAYYRAPHYDGSKPGEYFINTYKPEVRPRFEMQVLAYHEAIPGHHLQLAISQERSRLPAFRRFGGNTAFVEGWALYTERLAAEMELYTGDLDRMGMLSYDAWRASRLVVDTGLHALGWTREQAETFMLEHTALTRANIENEVDRYISWPGQALAYKVGQLEILRLRELARTALGDAFDIKRFHDVVLQNGAVTLPVLADQVNAWIAARSDG